MGRQTSTRSGDPKTPDDLRFAKDDSLTWAMASRRNGREYVEDYSLWLTIGISLYDLGDDGLKLWEEWSQQGKSYQAAGPKSSRRNGTRSRQPAVMA